MVRWHLFGENTIIYNPWSIVSFIGRPRAGLCPHWISTSDNRLVKEVIKLKRREAKITTEKLLRKEEVRKPLLTNIPYTFLFCKKSLTEARSSRRLLKASIPQ